MSFNNGSPLSEVPNFSYVYDLPPLLRRESSSSPGSDLMENNGYFTPDTEEDIAYHNEQFQNEWQAAMEEELEEGDNCLF